MSDTRSVHDTPPTPAPAQDVTARAAEVATEALFRDGGVMSWLIGTQEGRSAIPEPNVARVAVKALADAGLLARDLPTRDEIAELLSNWLDQEPVDNPRSHLPLADALVELLRGEGR